MSTLGGLLTSESVSAGHPDKICDRISDSILDAFLTRDPRARVACETFVADQRVIVAGEFRTADPEHFAAVRDEAAAIVRRTLREIGYGDAGHDIDPARCAIDVLFNRQSPNIAAGTDRDDGAIGAGDQGMMFGYATSETEALLPLPIWLAHQLIRRLTEARTSGRLPFLRPDAKSQVTVRYLDHGRAVVDTVVLSTQHAPGFDLASLREAVHEEVILPVIGAELRSPSFRTLVNPAGAFEIGGPKGDTGLTGRKIIVDSYGGACPHGGGAFSGKDATKVDRSGAYAARWLAKHVVAAGLAPRCTVQLAYAIGVPEPVSVAVDLHGDRSVDADVLALALANVFDLTPRGIIRELELDRPVFAPTAAFGHFGRDEPGFTWERTPRVVALLAALGRSPASVRRSGRVPESLPVGLTP